MNLSHTTNSCVICFGDNVSQEELFWSYPLRKGKFNFTYIELLLQTLNFSAVKNIWLILLFIKAVAYAFEAY